MREEQIDQIMQEIGLYGRVADNYSPPDAAEALADIRRSLEELVAHPSAPIKRGIIGYDGTTTQEKINYIAWKIAARYIDDKSAVEEIRKAIEILVDGLVENPSAAQEWAMIADGETWMIVNIGTDAYAYCRGMDYEDAFDLVRKLNGIEE